MTNHCENGNGRETQQSEDTVPYRGPTIELNEDENLFFSALCCTTWPLTGFKKGKARQLQTDTIVKRKLGFVKFKRISVVSLFN